MVEFELPKLMDQSFMALIPDQQRMVMKLFKKGILKTYTLSLDRSKLWSVVAANSEFEVLEILNKFPLISYMRPQIIPLMFHNESSPVYQFSLN
jgi:muconolactone delta-isomerase